MYFVAIILHFYFNYLDFFCFIFNVYYLKKIVSYSFYPQRQDQHFLRPLGLPLPLQPFFFFKMPFCPLDITFKLSGIFSSELFQIYFFLPFSLICELFLTLNFTNLFAQPSHIFSTICGICFYYFSYFKTIFLVVGRSLFVQA